MSVNLIIHEYNWLAEIDFILTCQKSRDRYQVSGRHPLVPQSSTARRDIDSRFGQKTSGGMLSYANLRTVHYSLIFVDVRSCVRIILFTTSNKHWTGIISGERCGHGIYEKFPQCVENQFWATWSDDKVDYSAD